MKQRMFLTILALGQMVIAVPAAAREPVPIEISSVGDDGLTRQLRLAIEERLRSSGRFEPGPEGSNPAALKMVIPRPVETERVRNRTRVRYRLQFRRAGEAFGFYQGTCWDNEMSDCARQVLFAATSALDAD